MFRWCVIALVAALWVVGCVPPRASDDYVEAYVAASRLERENHPVQAAERFGKAAELAERPRTRWQAAYQQARQLEVAGERQTASKLYLEIAEADPGSEMASRCLYYAGRMAFEDGDVEAGLGLMRRVLHEYHEKGLAPQAVRRSVQQLRDRQGPEAAIAFLAEEEEKLRGTDVGDAILYHWARLEKDRGNWRKALERYERMVELYPYPHSGLYDDALYEAAELADEHGEPQRALRYLEALVAWREDSIPTGSYYTIWTDDAQLLIGKIYLERLADPAGAARAFEELATFPDSTLADDGLWWASKAYLAQGDTRRACAKLRAILEGFPYSNQQRQTRQKFVELDCP
jgi:tetratricopeptide (TPR) repeat protein